MDMLNPYRWILLLGLAGSLVLGYFAWEKHIRNDERAKVVAEYNANISAQKVEAAKVLAAAIAETEAAKDQLRELTVNMEKDREIKQRQNDADLRARRAGPRLSFIAPVAGCGRGGDATQSDPASATGDPAPTVVQLPKQINDDLRDFAADAQSLAIDYGTLYAYVNNPKLVCELRP